MDIIDYSIAAMIAGLGLSFVPWGRLLKRKATDSRVELIIKVLEVVDLCEEHKKPGLADDLSDLIKKIAREKK